MGARGLRDSKAHPVPFTQSLLCDLQLGPVLLRFILRENVMDSPGANAGMGSRRSTVHAMESWLKCHRGVGGCPILQG